MMLLGIETATTVCAAAVVRDGVLLAENLVDERNVHAEQLMGMVDAALRRSSATLEQVAGIAVSIGPGSFTGLRIGLSVAKGLAYATGKPIVPVPTLQGMAQKATDAFGELEGLDSVLPLLDARRGDVYCAWYRITEGGLHPIWDQRVMALSAVPAAIRDGRVLVTGDARGAVERVVRDQFPGSWRQFHIVSDDVARCSAAAVAYVGEQLLRQGKGSDPGLLEPQYLRDFQSQ
jgi:tRNA threonylcarbamoyladenosine biosynthesis protein TsaB